MNQIVTWNLLREPMVRGAHATLRPMTTRRSVILGTTGRTSGRPIDVTLYAAEDGDRLVIVASNGGKPTDPSWVANLRAQPDVTVRIGKERRDVRAREVDGDERERLWAIAVAGFPLYATLRPQGPAHHPRVRARATRLMPAPLGKTPTKKMPNIQVFGLEDSNATRAALRFFRERRIVVHFVDLRKKPIAAGELRRFIDKLGAAALLDTESRPYKEQGLAHLSMDPAGITARLRRRRPPDPAAAGPLRRAGHRRQGRGRLEGLAGQARLTVSAWWGPRPAP